MPCLFRRLVRNFSFKLLFRRSKFETTSSGVRVGIPMGFRVSGCAGRMGVLVLPARLACLGARPPRTVSTTRGTVPLTMVHSTT